MGPSLMIRKWFMGKTGDGFEKQVLMITNGTLRIEWGKLADTARDRR